MFFLHLTQSWRGTPTYPYPEMQGLHSSLEVWRFLDVDVDVDVDVDIDVDVDVVDVVVDVDVDPCLEL